MASLVAKAQGQLCFDVVRKEPMNSFCPEVGQPRNFIPLQRIWNISQIRFGNTTGVSVHPPRYRGGTPDRSEFEEWCIQRGWGIRGKIFLGKQYARRIASRVKRGLRARD